MHVHIHVFMKLKYITLVSTLLMLSGCVVPAEYGVSRTRAGSSENLAIANELNDIAEEYWSRYSCKKGDSSFFKFDGNFYQLAGAKPTGTLLDLTPADKLNGIDATGVLSMESEARKDYSMTLSKWSDWSNDDVSWLFVSVNKKKGKWEIEDNSRLQSINCNSIPS